MFQVKERHMGRQKECEIIVPLETRSGNNGHVTGELDDTTKEDLMLMS